MARIHTAAEIQGTLAANGLTVIHLASGDRSWDPTSTRHTIVGPASVQYRQHPDGGITAQVVPLERRDGDL